MTDQEFDRIMIFAGILTTIIVVVYKLSNMI